MSDFHKILVSADFKDMTPSTHRHAAVAAALTLIEAKAAGGGGITLEGHMAHLSEYADSIQEALGTKTDG